MLKTLCLRLCSRFIRLFIHGVWLRLVIIFVGMWEFIAELRAVWNSVYISSTVFVDISLVAKLLLHLSRSSFSAWVLALWYMHILRGFCLMTLGFQLVMIIGIPSWSLIPGTIVDLSTRVGLVVKNKSKVLFILVGSRTICSSPTSFEISSRILDSPGAVPPGLGLSISQSISGRLKSPPSHMCSLFECLILLIDSRSSCIYSLVLPNWGDL